MDKDIYNQLMSVINQGNIKIDEPMSMYTTFKIGGKADFLVNPSTTEEVVAIVSHCMKKDIPYYVIGNGSNLLVGDKGYRGVIIHVSTNLNSVQVEKIDTTNREFDITHEKEYFKVVAEAGIMLSKLSHEIAMNELTGFEFAAGIPGSLGGAIAMNAGAYGGEMKDCVVAATVIDETGNVIKLNSEQLEFGYRMSAIQKRGLVVLEVEFEFTKGDKNAILDTINELNSRRKEKQPLEYPSAGSTFKRPEGHFAGKLIMDSGLRGFRIGDIMVSTKHCGFVINVGEGTAEDVKKVLSHVDNTVYEKFGIHLEPEVRLLGEF